MYVREGGGGLGDERNQYLYFDHACIPPEANSHMLPWYLYVRNVSFWPHLFLIEA